MKRWLFLLATPLMLLAQQYDQNDQRVSTEQIEKQLEDAETQYQHALKLFNPWYSGPLITGSATMCAPGLVVWQPYVYFTDTYGAFNEDRKWVDAPNNFSLSPQPLASFQTGVTSTVDTTISIFNTVAQWQQNQFSGGMTDTNWALGFCVYKQTLWIPGAKFSVSQTFPTGKYKNLDPTNLGLDATGGGAWKTKFQLNFSKVILWDTYHPMNTRISFNYTFATPIKVTNFNTYGGGYGTKGVVHPGNTFEVDLGLELSINQPWVAALDVQYTCTNQTKFNGISGTMTKGGSAPASVGKGYSDQLSLAPAIEYNFNDSMGIIAGAWFTVYGRNAGNFVSGIFSWYWTFP